MTKNTPTLEQRLFAAYGDGMWDLHKMHDKYKKLRHLPPDEFDDKFATLIQQQGRQYVEGVMKIINKRC